VDLKDSKYHLSFGISSTINQRSIDRANLFGVEVADPILSNRKLSSASGNANIGLLLFNRGFSIGLSIYNIIPIPNKLYTSILEPETSPLVFIQSGYQLPVGEQFTITPSLMFHTQQNANYNLDVNLGFAYHINNKDFVQLITSYKSFSENLSKGSQAIAMNIQMVFSSFFVGFHFEIPTSIVSNYTSGGHAIQFGYKFQEGKPKLLQSQLEEF
jgi:type IX secretion system PorP/SprF family membrane protein